MAEKILDFDELNDVDMGAVDAKVNRTLKGGRYLFEMKSAELKQGEDKQGNDRLELSFRAEVIDVLALDDKTLDKGDYIGQSVFERFYKPTTDNLGYVRAFMDNVMGAPVEGKFADLVELLNEGSEDGARIRFISRVNERTYNGNQQANLSREPKDFVGYENLTDEQAG